MTIKKAEEQIESTNNSEDKKHIIKVVAQLPVQPVRIVEDDDAIYHYVTIEEYLTQQANIRKD
jgi:hypothetical protein